MTSSSEFHLQQFRGLLMSLNTAMPCEVLEFNPATCKAKLQPQFEVKEIGKNPQKLPPIENVPVLFQRFKINNLQPVPIKTDKGVHSQASGTGEHNHAEMTFTQPIEMIPDLQKGDIVQVVFNQRAIDEALSGGTVYAGIKRLFSVHDAVVVGVFKQ